MTSITTWFSEYRKHPYGAGATLTDYAATVGIGVLALYIVIKIYREVRG